MIFKEKEYSEKELLEMAIAYLAEWCIAIDKKGTSWDDWDKHYKDACYENERRWSPINQMVRAYMEKKERLEGEKSNATQTEARSINAADYAA